MVLLWVSPHLSSIIFLIGIVSHCGITLAISHLCELLGVFTAHISVCYFISMVVYQGLLRTVRSLWNLFCGMWIFNLWHSKYNTFYRKAVQCASEPNWFLELWCGSTAIWNYSLYPGCLSVSNCFSLLLSVCNGKTFICVDNS